MPRRRPLTILLLLAVAAAAMAIMERDALKSALRGLRDTMRQPSGPAAAAPPAAPSASLHANGHTLMTDDPPPFDRPVAARSGMAISIGGRTLRPDLRFDMEASADTSLLVRGTVHGGTRAYLLKAAQEYGPAIRRRAGDVGAPLTAVAAGLWCLSDGPGLVIVTTVHRGTEQRAWYGKELRAEEHVPGAWQRLQGELLLRGLDVADDDVVTVYLWNKHRHDFRIDDMDVVFRSGDVLGRDSIRAHDLEDSARTTRPLPFARVECLGTVDPAGHGIRPGLAAPEEASVVPVPGGPHRWSYRPGDGVARLTDASGTPRCLVRPWCAATGDLLGFERVHVEALGDALLLIGYDTDPGDGGGMRIADLPAPRGALLRITAP